MPKKYPRTEAAPATLKECIEYFSDPNVALAYMVAIRWPDGEVACPTIREVPKQFAPGESEPMPNNRIHR